MAASFITFCGNWQRNAMRGVLVLAMGAVALAACAPATDCDDDSTPLPLGFELAAAERAASPLFVRVGQ